MGGKLTQAPATPELVERLKGLLVEEDRMHPLGCATWIEEVCVTVEEAAAALEAQQARIAELEVENERLRLTMLGGEDVAGFASSLPLAQVLDSFRTYETALRDSANSAQALADRYEKALREILEPLAAMKQRADASGRQLSGLAHGIAYSVSHLQDIARQALSSQGRHEGGESREWR